MGGDTLRESRPHMALREFAYEEIKRRLLSQRYSLGERLSEKKLAEELGIWHMPIYLALYRLYLEGLLKYLPGRGFLAARFEAEEFQSNIEIRMLLEPEAVALAVSRMTDKRLEAIRAAFARMDRLAHADDVVGFAEADVAFHHEIALATGNPRVARELSLLHQETSRFAVFLLDNRASLKSGQEAHQRILAALTARDAARTAREVKAHIAAFRDEVLAAAAVR